MLPTPPVLFVIFNRPDLTAQSFEAIRSAKPKQLFVAADGPRSTHPDDAQQCEQARDVVKQVDWDCEVQTLFRDENLGCKRGVRGAITWFFTHVEEGIILEDDCLPDASFFPYCAELLARYRDDERVMSICGENSFLSETDFETSDSYVVSVLPVIWGWATWRRAWDAYDKEMTAWKTEGSAEKVLSVFDRDHDAEFWSEQFDATAAGTIDTWDYQWVLSCLERKGLHMVPYTNLITNVGFDDRGTHTTHASCKNAEREMASIEFPLRHPETIKRNKEAERHMMDARFDTKAWLEKKAPRKLYRRVLGKLKRTFL